MDYFNNVLPFWALNMVAVLLFMQGQKALGFHQEYFKWVLKMNEGLKGLERHEGE